ncbi:MAG TPA: large conductance mechanosensitive channel protein MscL [Candidatus Saccharimonadales bacterium]|jgi:large conductance mechanosensitive channel|nr:large conductance mechanosensitive channel protein MscL [Candidatus Saccharimonadales bacterium]
MLKDFRKFILRGNVVDLAVAVVIGAAFNAVIQSVVRDFITPLITGFSSHGQLVQGQWKFALGTHHFSLNWGDVLNTLISFLIVAAVVFFVVVQPINKLNAFSNRSKEAEEPTEKKCPECLSTIPKDAKRCAFCTAKLK